ncbi:restriction endonuclease [Luteimonas sp. 50]|uniref:Restriction endonuclease n=1 Tax=Cognatiluteimonas sedimenti TaxID=2927791 RepID=A0ABT0A131_9GAMM|nr:restriction endonuclease [Lysobacter sedimenti]MCJ0824672.1 restriction endonuclease [Lysobacter sedimenti]
MAGGSLLVAVLAFVLVGGATTLYLRTIRLPREETVAGIAALAGMRWRDFIHLVLDALHKRGYERVFDTEATSDESDYMLERNGQRWLLSSKHGAAYVLGSTAIAEFANNIRMRGADGGLLVTPGQFAPEAARLAAAQRIELLDGTRLWPELRPLLPEAQRVAVSQPALANMKRFFALAWVGALAFAVVLYALSAHDAPAPAASAPTTAATPATPATPADVAGAPGAAPAAPATRDGVAVLPAPTDPAQLEQRRQEATRAISTLAHVDRALWSTQSTLLVYLADPDGDPMADICPLLEHYDELRASRIQLQPPPGSTRPVRFLQCRSY